MMLRKRLYKVPVSTCQMISALHVLIAFDETLNRRQVECCRFPVLMANMMPTGSPLTAGLTSSASGEDRESPPKQALVLFWEHRVFEACRSDHRVALTCGPVFAY